MKRIIFALIFLSSTGFTAGLTYHVPDLGEVPPILTIQDGIDRAGNGDMVLVADGNYSGTGNFDLDFQGKAVVVRSQNGPENCIIDCNGQGRGFYFHSGEGHSSVVDGFTIINGLADFGGGIECDNSSPTILNCTIGLPGAGNTASFYGGGIDLFFSSAVVTDCRITHNLASYGGGVNCEVDTAAISFSVIAENTSSQGGGAVCCFDSSAILKSCAIAKNTTADVGSIYLFNANPEIRNCTIIDNIGLNNFGGIYRSDDNSTAVIVNSILWNNGDELFNCDGMARYSCIQDGDIGQGNIFTEPNLVIDPLLSVGPYFLSNISQQLIYSDCIDAGDPLSTLDTGDPNYKAVTDSNYAPDAGRVDIGYHHKVAIDANVPNYDLTTAVVAAGAAGDIDPNHPTPQPYPHYRVVELTAYPADPNIRVKEWVDSNAAPYLDPNDPNTYRAMMNMNRSVTVEFEQIPRYTLTVTPGANGNVSIRRITVFDGTVVTITAYPAPGYRVASWTNTDDVPGWNMNVNTVTVTANVIVTVLFEPDLNITYHVPGEHDYLSIQDALNLAVNGDTILISPGYYTGTGFFVNQNITISGVGNPNQVVIDPSGQQEFGFVLNGAGGSGQVTLNNLTIANAFRRSINRLAPINPGSDGLNSSAMFGAGIGVNGNHLITNCIIRNCGVESGLPSAGNPGALSTDPCNVPSKSSGGKGGNSGNVGGGGMYINWGSPVIRNCVFDGCYAISGDAADGGLGLTASSPIDPNDPNTAGGRGGDGGSAGSAQGGAVFCDIVTNPTFINCVFRDCNTISGDGGNGANGGAGADPAFGGDGRGGDAGVPGPSEGGAVYCDFFSSVNFTSCSFINNRCTAGRGGDGGNGVAGINNTNFRGGVGGLVEVTDSYVGSPQNQLHPDNFTAHGGSLACTWGSAAIFTDCNITDSHVQGSISGQGGWPAFGRQAPPRKNYRIPSAGGGIYTGPASTGRFIRCRTMNNQTTHDPNELFTGDEYTGYGGGMCFDGRNLPPATTFVEVNDCNFIGNFAPVGGGVRAISVSDINIVDSNFGENSAFLGGGMYSVRSTIKITGCIFSDNIADSNFNEPNRIYGFGGGLYSASSDAVISDCTVTGNRSIGSGGGIYLSGDALTPLDGAITLKNCLVTKNTAHVDGGGISSNWYAKPNIENCTIADNRVYGLDSYGGGFFAAYGSDNEIINSIIWGNNGIYGSQIALDNGNEYFSIPSKLSITHSDVDMQKGLDFNSLLPGIGSTLPRPTGTAVLIDGDTIYDQFNAGAQWVKVIATLVQPYSSTMVNWASASSVSVMRQDVADLQASVLSTLSPAQFTVRHQLENSAVFSGEVTQAGLASLLANPAVAYVEPVREVHPMLAQAIPLANALIARTTYNGQGLAIAIVDTGVDYTHPRLGGGGFPNNKVIGGYDFGNDDNDPMPGEPYPPYEAHGTACAGIAAGQLYKFQDYIGGVAYNAGIYALRISDVNGDMYTDAGIAAWDWCLKHRNDNAAYPLKVVSNSWGIPYFPFDDPAFADAVFPAAAVTVQKLVDAGIAVLAASGNDGFAGDGISWPAAMSNIISVGAVYDTTDMVTDYSNTADILDILAPADPMYTLDIAGPAGYASGDYWPNFNGTSSACPFAAGAVLDLQSAAYQEMGVYLSPDAARNLLILTGDPVTDTKVDITKPRVNLGAAITLLKTSEPIHVEPNCVINWDPNTGWAPGSHIIDDDPCFVGPYYLSHIDAGQLYDSNCIDMGRDLAVDINLATYTTRTDGQLDVNYVDLGYHHQPLFDLPKYRLTIELHVDANILPNYEPNVIPDIDPFDPNDGLYNIYTMVPISVIPPPPYGFQTRWAGTIRDRLPEPNNVNSTNVALMDMDKTVTIDFVKVSRRLTIEIIGQGTVTTDPPDDHNGVFLQDMVVKLSATAAPGYRLKRWYGTDRQPAWGAVTNEVTMDTDKTVRVEFYVAGPITVGPGQEYETIGEGVNAASFGDTVWIMPGVYTGQDNVDIDLEGKSITITGMNPNEPNIVASTVIDCAGTEIDNHRAFIFQSGEDANTVLLGLTIMNGYVCGEYGGDENIDPNGNIDVNDMNGVEVVGDAYGGGIYITNNSSPSIIKCVIKNCVVTGAQGGHGGGGITWIDASNNGLPGGRGGDGLGDGFGGGIFCDVNCSPVISECTFIENRASGGAGGNGGWGGSPLELGLTGTEGRGGNGGDGLGYGYGGAVYYAPKACPRITNCIFNENKATGGLAGIGGRRGLGPAITPPIFGNYAPNGFSFGSGFGGGIWHSGICTVNITGTTFVGNGAYDQYYGHITPKSFAWGGYPIYPEYYHQGGGIYSDVNSMALTITDCNFVENLGGGVYCAGDTNAVFENCGFIGNSAAYEGGGVYIGPDSNAVLNNCVFTRNSTDLDGGGLDTDSDVELVECAFYGNAAAGYGGAVHADANLTLLELNLDSCAIADNNATRGGAVYFKNVSVGFNDCYVMNNHAELTGALHFIDSTVMFDTGDISGNKSTGDNSHGGAMTCVDTSLTIQHCSINNNEASGLQAVGGAIYLTNCDGAPVIKNCLFTGNYATQNGGAIAAYVASNPKISNCTFSDSSIEQITGTGGAIFTDWTSSAQITDCIFHQSNRIAVYESTPGRITLGHSLFYQNYHGDFYKASLARNFRTYDANNPTSPNLAELAALNAATIGGHKASDPLFASGPLGSYYLSQPPDQINQSEAVDNGSVTAGSVSLQRFTTRTGNWDGLVYGDPGYSTGDIGLVDMGYHYYDTDEVELVSLNAYVIGGHGTITFDPAPVIWPDQYFKGTVVTVRAQPYAGWLVKRWTGTDDDSSTKLTNRLIMHTDRIVTVEYRQPRDIDVPGDYTSIERAIDEAMDGDTIIVAPGEYTSGDLQFEIDGKAITLTSTNPDDPCVVASTILRERIEFTNVGPDTIINGFTLRDFSYFTPDPLDASGCGVDGYNAGSVYGGALQIGSPWGWSWYAGLLASWEWAQPASPTIRNCVIRNTGVNPGNGANGAAGCPGKPGGDGGWPGRAYGGAVYISPNSKPAFINCKIIDCRAEGADGGKGGDAGGGPYGGHGGAWGDPNGSWWDYGPFEEYWKYSGLGGGVYCDRASEPNFIDCTFQGNIAYGGVCGKTGEPMLINWVDNYYRIDRFGGAVFCAAQSSPRFTDCNFIDNTADINGPATHHEGAAVALSDDPYLSYGGAVAFDAGASPRFINCVFSDNQATIGGAIYAEQAELYADDSEFIDNFAYRGGAIYLSEALTRIGMSSFIDNEANGPGEVNGPAYAGSGGALYLFNTDTRVADCEITDNMAFASGGGVCIYDGNDVMLHNCLIANNTAGRDGGGISVNQYSETAISSCTIADNIVTSEGFVNGYGGGLFCSYAAYTSVLDSIIWSNSAGLGAQIAMGTGFGPIHLPSEVSVSYSDVQGGAVAVYGIDPITGCTLIWDEITNLHGTSLWNPRFVSNALGDYFLSDPNTGDPNQTVFSPCIDKGSGDANYLDMYKHTTRTDLRVDKGRLDIGYHYVRRADIVGDFNFDGRVDFLDWVIFNTHWLEQDCATPDWCHGTDMNRDGEVDNIDYAMFAINYGEVESTPPTPDPMMWNVPPRALDDTRIGMLAATAVDNSGYPVQYYFDCFYGNCHDSDWQYRPDYIDTGLTKDLEYGYRVKARDVKTDAYGVIDPARCAETRWSFVGYVIAGDMNAPVPTDNDPPTPDPMTWAIWPGAISHEAITMEATEANDISPVEYLFERCLGDCNVSTWVVDYNWVSSNAAYTDIGLDPCTTYTYRVMARDLSTNRNETAWSPIGAAATWEEPDLIPPTPNPSRLIQLRLVPGSGSFDWSAEMTAEAAVDDRYDVEYRFECNIGGLSSGWQTDNYYIVMIGGPYVDARFRVWVRDTSPNHNITAPSSWYPVQSDVP
ncbi:MAG: right-handed parallel beta-helix repeat-containing protein [Planctomycetota bacterium]